VGCNMITPIDNRYEVTTQSALTKTELYLSTYCSVLYILQSLTNKVINLFTIYIYAKPKATRIH